MQFAIKATLEYIDGDSICEVASPFLPLYVATKNPSFLNFSFIHLIDDSSFSPASILFKITIVDNKKSTFSSSSYF